MVGLADLPGGESFSEAFGISADGAVVVGLSRSAASGSLYEAFRWTESEGMVGLGDLPGGAFHSTAYPTARWKAQRVVEAFATRIGVVCPAQSTRLGCHAPSRTARI